MMHGYRPETNRPGHHMTVIQSLPLTIGLESKRLIVLDALRRQRNVADYRGMTSTQRPQSTSLLRRDG
jgi:hypothetical protein